jgi:hypothetical protein
MTLQTITPSIGSPDAPAAPDELPAARTQLADGLRRLAARLAPEPGAAVRNATSH